MNRKMGRIALILFSAGISLIAAQVSRGAEPWFELKDFGPVTQRVAVTIENPADVPVSAAVVRLPMGQVRKVLPDANPTQVCVVDPATKPARREAADRNFIPFQVRARMLIFSVPLAPQEKKQVFIYTAPKRLNMPGFPAGTAFDSRHAYRSFENRFAAFRMETGPGANTTGMAIDCFGKTRAGLGLRLQEIYGTGQDSYHKLNDWGVDILKVGSGPGLGGVYVLSGDEMGRAGEVDTFVDPVYQGPVETRVKVTAPVTVAGKTVNVTRTLTLVADDRAIHDEVSVEGDDVGGLQIGLGVRDLPNCVWVEKPDDGYAFQTGDANQPNYKAVGLGCTFDPAEYVRTIDLPDKSNGGHVYVLKGKQENGKLLSRHRLTDIWDMDGQLEQNVEKPEALRQPMEAWLKNWSQQERQPVKVELAAEAESP